MLEVAATFQTWRAGSLQKAPTAHSAAGWLGWLLIQKLWMPEACYTPSTSCASTEDVEQGALQIDAAASAPTRAALCGVLQLPIGILLQVPALHWRQLRNRRKVQVISVSEHAQLRGRRAVTAAYDADGLRGRQQLAVSCSVAAPQRHTACMADRAQTSSCVAKQVLGRQLAWAPGLSAPSTSQCHQKGCGSRALGRRRWSPARAVAAPGAAATAAARARRCPAPPRSAPRPAHSNHAQPHWPQSNPAQPHWSEVIRNYFTVLPATTQACIKCC